LSAITHNQSLRGFIEEPADRLEVGKFFRIGRFCPGTHVTWSLTLTEAIHVVFGTFTRGENDALVATLSAAGAWKWVSRRMKLIPLRGRGVRGGLLRTGRTHP